jgi:ABC-type uncharacterized transport system involved in gliding motility auxiliary subunit
MKHPPFVLVASLLSVIVFAGFNLAAHKWLVPVRADFTGERLYTLSESSRKVLRRLAEPVDLELVFTRAGAADYPALRAHAGRVRELLAEIASRSIGKVRIRETDPPPFSADEDRVAIVGVQALAAGEGDPIYLGLIGRNSADDEIVIPFLSPDRDALLEYDLVRLIAQLDNPDPARIAIVTGLPAFGGAGTSEADPLLLREMARAFRLESMLPGFDALPPDTGVLVMIHPPPLSDWQTYVVDQFLVGGGRALIAVDPAAIAAAEAGRADQSGLGRLAQTLGVELVGTVVSDPALGLPVEVDGGQGRRRIERDPRLIGLEGDRLARADPVTADLTRAVNLSHAGELLNQNGSRRFEPLLTASPAGAGARPPVIAARLSGPLVSAFAQPPQAPPLPEDPVEAQVVQEAMARRPPFLANSEADADVILIADTDLFDARLFANPADGQVFADNAAFVLNALDNLSGDPALLSLRSRSPAARPMTRLDALEEVGRARLAQKEPELRAEIASVTAQITSLMSAPVEADLVRADGASDLAALRARAGDLRAQLRDLQRSQRADLEALERRLVVLNVWVPPMLAGLAGLAVFLWRSRRRRT